MPTPKANAMKSKINLVERYRQSQLEWNAALAGLRPADYERMVYRRWRLKDIQGHVLSYLQLSQRHICTYLKSKRLASPRAPTYSYFNRREAERLKNVPFAQLRGEMEAAFADLFDLLPALKDEDLRRVFPSQWWNSKYNTTLRSILREDAEHIRIHAADVVKWRQGLERG